MLNISKEESLALKGIAVLLILVCHLIGGGFGFRYVTPMGGIGVAIFLFLSGYGVNESFAKKSLTNFWENKITRILLPYLLWIIIVIPISYFLYGRISWFPRYWYLEYLFLWYGLFWLTKKIFTRSANPIMLFVSLVMFCFLPNLQSEQSFSFILGVLLSSNKDKLENSSRYQYMILSLLLMLFGVLSLGLKQFDFVRAFHEDHLFVKLLQLLIKLPIGLSIIIMYVIGANKFFYTKILSSLGILSLEVYLVQMSLYGYISYSFGRLCLVLVLLTFFVSALYKMLKIFNNYKWY